MWTAEHEEWCETQDTCEVGIERMAICDTQGDVLNAEPFDWSEQWAWARCCECGARAVWEEPEVMEVA